MMEEPFFLDISCRRFFRKCRPEGKAVYELRNGQPVEYEYGFARVEFLGEETVTQVIFGPLDAEPILGVVALESTGLVVDPVTKTLKRIHAKPLK